jgi:hypothetical protein
MNIKLIILLAVLLSIPYMCQNDPDSVPLLVFIAILLVFMQGKETFQLYYNLAEIAEGNYIVETKSGKRLMSTAVTPVLCDNFLIANSSSLPKKQEDGWKLKQVTKGVYMFFKPTLEECLYVGNNNELRSMAPINCPKQNLCGLEKLNYKGELDNQNDYRSYFRLTKADNNGVYIISNNNNMYVCINETGVGMVNKPSENCVFYFNKF